MQGALVTILLLAILAGAVFVGHYGWVLAGDVAMPAWGWLMLGLGIFVTLLVGFGLMALVFYSSRAGFDEPPEVVQEKKHRAAKWAKMIPRREKTAPVLATPPRKSVRHTRWNVRFGSLADIAEFIRYVGFVPRADIRDLRR